MISLTSAIDKMLELVYPSNVACCICDREAIMNEAPYICEECKKELIFSNAQRIVETEQKELLVYYAFEYEDKVKQLVHNLKYNNKRYIAKSMAYYLNKMIELNEIEFDIITPVPLHVNRQKSRGYNQCAILCKELDACHTAKYKEALVRTRDTKMQATLTPEQRRTNVIDAFDVAMDVKGKRILLVDDVTTTGSTMKECSKILLKSGAEIVIGLTLAA